MQRHFLLIHLSSAVSNKQIFLITLEVNSSVKQTKKILYMFNLFKNETRMNHFFANYEHSDLCNKSVRLSQAVCDSM